MGALRSQEPMVRYADVQTTFHGVRALTAASSAAALAALTVSWDLRMGWVGVALALFALADALYRRRKPDRSPVLHLMLDSVVLGSVVLWVGGPALITAPYAYLLTATLIVLPLARALLVASYLTAWVVATQFALLPSSEGAQKAVLGSLAVLVPVAAMAILVLVAGRAVRRTVRRQEALVEEARRADRVKRLLAYLNALELGVAALDDDQEGASESIRRVACHAARIGRELDLPRVGSTGETLQSANTSLVVDDVTPLLESLRAAVVETFEQVVILVVDDDKVISRILELDLAGPGRRVLVAETVAEAERAIANEDVSLIVLDLFLPDGDGRSVLAELRERPETRHTPVFVLSANSSPLAKSECIALGANAYIEKPFDRSSLAARVAAHLIHPYREAAPQTHPAEPSPGRHAGRTRRVLVAEDDQITAALISHRLGRVGYEVTHCSNGARAYEEAQSGSYGLIILDQKMPGMDGFEVLGRLRDAEEFDAVPIIMLTGMGREDDVVKAFELGANDYVLKPFSPVELTARVQHLAGLS